MPRILEWSLKLALAFVLVVIAVRALGWVRLKLREDPAGHMLRVAYVGRSGDGPEDIGALLEPIRAKAKLPCLTAVAVRDGKVIAEGVCGVRKAGSPESAEIGDKFHLGSDTKAMTATLMAVLVEEGKLKWTTTVGEVFGAAVPGMDEEWKAVTLEQLLTHRAGAPAGLDAGGLWGRLWQMKGTPTDQRMELVAGVVSRPPDPAPGSTFVYSNAGYAIAGAMAEKVTGKAWEDLLQEKVFGPLKITSAGFGAPGDAAKVDQPRGHRSSGAAVEPGPKADNPPAIGPGGSAHMTMADWARFVLAHVRGDSANPKRECALLNPESYDKLHTPVGEYAMGWGVSTRGWAKGKGQGARGVTLSHSGSNTMWYCVAWVAPERDLAILVATNQGGNVAAKAADEAVGAMIKKIEEGK